MGLDIAFNREAAIKAGIKLSTMTNDGTPIENPQNATEIDYNEWCTREIEVIRIPGTLHFTENNGIDSIVVRANKWGETYAPLTKWLITNNIEWSEF